jgi:hypothetical protein
LLKGLLVLAFSEMKGMIKKSAFIVSQKLRLNMAKLGVYNATNVPAVANNF